MHFNIKYFRHRHEQFDFVMHSVYYIFSHAISQFSFISIVFAFCFINIALPCYVTRSPLFCFFNNLPIISKSELY